MTFRYHGNWCGPGWSDGVYTSSRRGFAPAVDEFDETCRQHDFALAGGATDFAADDRFYQSNVGKGAKRTIAALAVKARRTAQSLTSTPPLQNSFAISLSNNMVSNKNQKKNLRAEKTKTKVPTSLVPIKNNNGSTRAAPVSIATKRTSSSPVMKTTPSGVMITHRSYLQPITNWGTFRADPIPCNPGLAGSFPWLAKLARRYEQYRFVKLKYEFRSVVASSQSGIVMLSFDFDAADAGPTSKADQAQTVPNTETNVWMNNELAVRTDSTWRFVRAGTLLPNLDVKTYDLGNMWFSSNYGNNAVGGELYVEYAVEFRRPTDGPESCGTLSTNTTSFTAPFTGNTTITGAAFPFAKSTVFANDLVVVAGGDYSISFVVTGSSIVGGPTYPTISSNSGTSQIDDLVISNAGSKSHALYKVRCETGDIISWPSAGTGTTISNVTLYVAAIDYTSFV